MWSTVHHKPSSKSDRPRGVLQPCQVSPRRLFLAASHIHRAFISNSLCLLFTNGKAASNGLWRHKYPVMGPGYGDTIACPFRPPGMGTLRGVGSERTKTGYRWPRWSCATLGSKSWEGDWGCDEGAHSVDYKLGLGTDSHVGEVCYYYKQDH